MQMNYRSTPASNLHTTFNIYWPIISSKFISCATEMDLSCSNSASVKSAIECTLRDEAVELEWVESRSNKNIARRSLSADGLEAGIC